MPERTLKFTSKTKTEKSLKSFYARIAVMMVNVKHFASKIS